MCAVMFLCGLQKHMLGISLQWVLGTCVLRMRTLKSREINCPSWVLRRNREGSNKLLVRYRSESKTKLRLERNCVSFLHIISFLKIKTLPCKYGRWTSQVIGNLRFAAWLRAELEET